MERGAVEGSLSSDFLSTYIVRELSPSEVGSRSRCYQKRAFWEKNDPLRKDLENFIPKGFTISQIHVLCANFVKFGQPEIGKRALFTGQKKQKIGSLSRSRFCADPPKSARANVHTVPQISSKSVQFRRSYS